MIAIYALEDPRDGHIRYVGKSYQPEERFRAHLRDRTGTRRGRWVRSLKALGLAPVLRVLQETTEECWQRDEAAWIAIARLDGCDLTNHTSGGEGLQNPDHSTRAKISAIRRAWNAQHRNEVLTMARNPERRQKISAALTGRSKSPEHVARLPQNRKGHRLSPEQREQRVSYLRKGTGFSGHRHSEETRKIISEKVRGNKSHLGRTLSEEHRKNISNANRGLKRSEETKERIRQAKLDYWRRKKAEATSPSSPSSC